MSDFNLDRLADNWPSPLIARSEVKAFSGGLLHPRTMANLDCLGKGPKKIQIGKRIAYETRDLIAWMKARQESV